MSKTASFNGLGAPANLSSWTAWDSLTCQVAMPTGRVAADGSHPVRITRIDAYLGGHGASTSAHFTYRGVNSSTFTIPATSGAPDDPDDMRGAAISIYNADATGDSFPLRVSGYSAVWYGWDTDSGNAITSEGGTEKANASLTGLLTYFTAPSAPTGVSVTNVGGGKQKISWDAPSDLGGYASTSVDYIIKRATNAAMTANVATARTSATSFTVSGLDPDTRYYYQVFATNTVTDHFDTTGVGSSVVSAVTYDVPSAPTGVAVAVQSATAAKITWAAPADDGGTGITGYTVQYATASDFTGATTVSAGASGVTVSGLTPGQRYYWRVAASNAAGRGAYSAAANATQWDVPAAPAGVTVTPSATTAAVAWSAPATGGQPITSYTIQWSTDSFATIAGSTTSTTTSKTITGLTPGTTYKARVRATNSVGAGAWSTAATFATLSGARVGDGTAWQAGIVQVGDGTAWGTTLVQVADGTAWHPAS